MKNFLLVFILVFSLSACGHTPAESPSDNVDENKDGEVMTDSEASVDSTDKSASDEDMNSSTGSQKGGQAGQAESESKEMEGDKEDVKAIFSDTIKVTSIKENDLLVSPALIEGEADVESGVVMVELRKTDHSLTSDSVEAVVRDGKFKVSKFWFQFKNTDEGFVAVYDKDNKDNLVEIPVKFQTVK